MRNFYLFLWFFWLIRVVLCTIFSGFVFAALITLYSYAKQGFIPLDSEVIEALFKIWKFWFLILLNITLLFALFRSVKYLFNRCYKGYIVRLKKCFKEKESPYIEPVGYGDLLKVWRKWFFSLIWLSAGCMITAFIFTHFFTSYESLFSWFSIYLLYVFIALAALPSFMLLFSKCKMIKVEKC